MTIHIHVTYEDIQNGEPSHCSLCPIARAVARAFHVEPNEVHVNADDVLVIRDEDELVLRLPKPASEFVIAYDAHHAVQPFWFTAAIESKGFSS